MESVRSESSEGKSIRDQGDVAELVRFLKDRRVAVLSGAGCSTESGIPDYRGPDGRLRVRRPIQYGEFVADDAVRRRYWARSAFGWPRFARACPNAAHQALATLEAVGVVEGVITQNVDGLHGEAGSDRVVELHGSLSRVRCLECGAVRSRAWVQEWILRANADWVAEEAELRPDGDAVLPDAAYASFLTPECPECRGVLKPDVVFFGENVPRPRLTEAWDLFEAADALLVVGSSLSVFSGRRFVHRAVKEGRPVGIVNRGSTRADDVAELKVEGRAGEVLPRVVESLR